MARYYDLHTDLQFVALDLSEQLRPGTFEHALDYLIDHQLDLSHFDARYRNDDTGAPAYPPAMLLKVVLFAYSQGLIGSRPIRQRLCQGCDLHGLEWKQPTALHHHRPVCQPAWR